MGIFRIFSGRSQHSGTQADTSDEDERTLLKELVEAQAEVARLQAMPLSVFVGKTTKGIRITQFGPMTYSIDNKDDAIARAKADVAELKAKIKGNGLVLVRRKPTQTHTKSAQKRNTK